MPVSIDSTSAWIVVERAYTTDPLGVRGDALCGATAHPYPSPGRPGPAMAVRAVRRALIGCVESDAVVREITATGARPQLLPALLRFALTSSSRYWTGLALGWLEAGVPIADLVAPSGSSRTPHDNPNPYATGRFGSGAKATTA